MPSARKECISFSISNFAPASPALMPRVGSSIMNKRRRVANIAGQQDFLSFFA